MNALSKQKQQAILEFLEEESGQDQMEFVLIAAIVSLCAVAALKGLSANILGAWQGVATKFSSSI